METVKVGPEKSDGENPSRLEKANVHNLQAPSAHHSTSLTPTLTTRTDNLDKVCR